MLQSTIKGTEILIQFANSLWQMHINSGIFQVNSNLHECIAASYIENPTNQLNLCILCLVTAQTILLHSMKNK